MRTVRIVAMALAFLTAMATPVLAGGDAGRGEKVFKKCKACHQVGAGAKSRVGPELNGVIGRRIAGAPSFKYSKAFKAENAKGLIWNIETLDAFLKKPRKFIRKNKMAFPGLKKQKHRDDVIAYLQKFNN